MDTSMYGLLTGGIFALLAIRRSQADADPMLIDLEAQAAVFVIFD